MVEILKSTFSIPVQKILKTPPLDPDSPRCNKGAPFIDFLGGRKFSETNSRHEAKNKKHAKQLLHNPKS